MKTTVVPAQITSVEDKIAGNLTFMQVFLLVMGMLGAVVLYAVITPRLHLSIIKILLISLELIFFASLALRIKGRIVADWLVLLLRFKARPRIYVFTKNDLATRDIPLVVRKKEVKHEVVSAKQHVIIPALSLPDKDQIGKILKSPVLTVRFAFSKKGGIDVSLTPVEG